MSEPRTTTFNFGDGQVEDSTFTDIDSSADRVLEAKGGRRNLFQRIRHDPWRTREEVNWTKAGALATIVLGLLAIAATVIFGG